MYKKKPDRLLFVNVFLLIFAGIFIFFSASLGFLERGSTFYKIVFNQVFLGLVVGFILFFFTFKINYKQWEKWALAILIFAILLNFLVVVSPLGFEYNGAKRWLKLGQFSFQPSELLKLALIIYLSAWFASRRESVGSFRAGFFPFVFIMGFSSIVLVLQNDVGTLGVIAISSLLLFVIAGGRFSQVIILILMGVLLLFLLAQVRDHLSERISVFLDQSIDPTGMGYQIKQALIAIGSGGFLGRGFGMSIQKFNYLPEPIGDSVFAVFAEEFGFIGSVALVGLFLFFLYRGFYISSRAPDLFAKFLGSGIVILIVTQSFINISAMTGILPLTGIPLVFISKGGSALAIAIAETGILINISKYCN